MLAPARVMSLKPGTIPCGSPLLHHHTNTPTRSQSQRSIILPYTPSHPHASASDNSTTSSSRSVQNMPSGPALLSKAPCTQKALAKRLEAGQPRQPKAHDGPRTTHVHTHKGINSIPCSTTRTLYAYKSSVGAMTIQRSRCMNMQHAPSCWHKVCAALQQYLGCIWRVLCMQRARTSR